MNSSILHVKLKKMERKIGHDFYKKPKLTRVKFCMLFFYLISIISGLQPLFSQSVYQPIPRESNNVWVQDFNKKISSYSYTQFLKEIPPASVKEAKELIEKRRKTLSENASTNHYFVHTVLNSYLNRIYKEIASKNALIDTTKIRLLISRETDVNAASYGEGTLVVNLGLIAYAKNESQVAFVLCHEIAHFMLNHFETKVKQYLNTVYSKDFKKKIKQIQSSEYSQTQEATKLVKSISLESSHGSRSNEKQADSLGYIFMSNTQYDTREIISCLKFLDSSDYKHIHQNLTLEQTFHSSHYTFDKEWLSPNNEGVATKQIETDNEKKIEDSLRSHPECEKRIGYLKLTPKPNTKVNIQKSEDVQKSIRIAQYECIQSEFDFDNIGDCLFETLILLKTYPTDPYMHTMVGKCFNKLYKAQKEHNLRKLVSLPSVFQKENYRELVNFIENLRLSEISNIGYYYLYDKLAEYKEEEFIYQLYLNAQNTGDAEKIATSKKAYKTSFPNGKYSKELL
jgi:Zn-dependent protease with chaperone function